MRGMQDGLSRDGRQGTAPGRVGQQCKDCLLVCRLHNYLGARMLMCLSPFFDYPRNSRLSGRVFSFGDAHTPPKSLPPGHPHSLITLAALGVSHAVTFPRFHPQPSQGPRPSHTMGGAAVHPVIAVTPASQSSNYVRVCVCACMSEGEDSLSRGGMEHQDPIKICVRVPSSVVR
jgi:hypothetical protein